MAYKAERLRAFDAVGGQYYSYWLDYVTYNSERVAGKLQLQPQPFYLTRNVVSGVSQRSDEERSPYAIVGANVLNLPDFPENLDQLARARAYSRSRGQTAALAMTVASLGKTREMIASKATGLAAQTVEISRRIDHARKRGQLVKRNTSLANAWLEYFYGWKPFFSDLSAGMKTIAEATPEVAWISGRAKAPVNQRQESGNDPKRVTVYSGTQTSTYSMRAEVVNPNLWMANRLGLINPGAVLWDLVPWSFVVNLFVNANSLIGSVSEEVGLSVSGYNLTRTTRLSRVVTDSSSDGKLYTVSPCDMLDKRRTLGALPISVVWTRPVINWELAVTASALLLQKVNKLNSMADRVYRGWAYRHTYTE